MVVLNMKPSVEFFAQYGVEMDTSYYPFLQLRCAIIGCVLYLLSDLLFQPPKHSPKEISKSQSKSSEHCSLLRIFMFLHNMALCTFSLLCFMNTAPVVWELFNHPQGWSYACDQGWNKAFDGSFGFWAYSFYLSKFYEFIDTWIVIARGRRPIFLQVFHHIGAIFGMWMCMVLKSTGGWIFIIENSFIHSIMYFYYAMSVLKIKLPFKSLITKLQMIQFVVGNSIALAQMYFYGDLLPTADLVCIWYHIIYTSVLFSLFNAFYQKTYKKGKLKGKGKSSHDKNKAKKLD